MSARARLRKAVLRMQRQHGNHRKLPGWRLSQTLRRPSLSQELSQFWQDAKRTCPPYQADGGGEEKSHHTVVIMEPVMNRKREVEVEVMNI
ncbi:hypothetical protein Celaphus_00011260 [Cervus elaphus hippelaphus]|uniref:Uncharacterized protein n=1 Tax=Cervus elaphus hippelaphus TaxID=46360 RepID=A0A212CQV7_CEREH|nr:hypothetical protein Celaphus_00011260 [Cervus elaphus hippelaphus]